TAATLVVTLGACDTRVGHIGGITGPGAGTGTNGGTTSGSGSATDSAAVVSLSISPTSASIAVGATQSFSATARNASGASVAPTIAWSSSNHSVATIDG